jgi:RNA ligase (TIGR02306 family)
MENLESVCYVAKIIDIKPIKNADKIELIIINGWSSIVTKGEYKISDLCIIAVTDAIIPETLAESLNIKNFLRKGNRVRTIKLKGVYSDCLLIPNEIINKPLYDGMDCMKELGITKYEPPVEMRQLPSGRKIKYKDNPKFQVYYKFPNIKNVPDIFNENDDVEITRKIHGTNSRYGFVKKVKLSLLDKIKLFLNNKFNIGGTKWKYCNYEFIYGSSRVQKGSDSNGFYETDVWKEIADRYNIKKKLFKTLDYEDIRPILGDGIILYGEIYGPEIQKNYDYQLKDIDIKFFDIIIDKDYIAQDNSKFFIEHTLGLKYVDVLYKGRWSKEIQDKFVFNQFIPNTHIPEEGIVIKALDGNRLKTAKVINPDYLIYAEKENVGDSH